MARRIKHPAARARKRASATNTTGRKKARYFTPGTGALREIRRLQKSVNLLIPAALFFRTVREISGHRAPEITGWTAEALLEIQEVREISGHLAPKITGWTAKALLAIQEAAEDFLVHLFEDAMLCAIHTKSVTLMKEDFQFACRLCGKGQTGDGYRMVRHGVMFSLEQPFCKFFDREWLKIYSCSCQRGQ